MSEISNKQEKLIIFLLTEKSIDQACEKVGINPATYWRWMQDENFLKEYRKARRGILEITVAKLQSVTFQAVETLERNLTCENPAAEIRAAQTIISESLRGLELLELENRLELLEDAMKDAEGK